MAYFSARYFSAKLFSVISHVSDEVTKKKRLGSGASLFWFQDLKEKREEKRDYIKVIKAERKEIKRVIKESSDNSLAFKLAQDELEKVSHEIAILENQLKEIEKEIKAASAAIKRKKQNDDAFMLLFNY